MNFYAKHSEALAGLVMLGRTCYIGTGNLSRFKSEIASFVFGSFLYSSAIQDGKAQ